MSDLLEPPPSLTEKLTARKVFRAIGAGIFLLANIINSICIAAIFIYIGATIPALRPYAGYVAFYTLGARTIFLVGVFVIGCYWCCLRLVAPKQAGSSIKEWGLKWGLKVQETLYPSNGKLGKAGRRYFAAIGVLGLFNGLSSIFRSWKEPEFSRYQFVMGVYFLICAARSFYIAYVGRVATKKGARGENKTMGNNDNQPESDEVTPAGEYNTTQ